MKIEEAIEFIKKEYWGGKSYLVEGITQDDTFRSEGGIRKQWDNRTEGNTQVFFIRKRLGHKPGLWDSEIVKLEVEEG